MEPWKREILDLLTLNDQHDYTFHDWADKQYSVVDLLDIQPIRDVAIRILGDDFVDEIIEEEVSSILSGTDDELTHRILNFVPSETYDVVKQKMARYL